jgi:hypothetical protein
MVMDDDYERGASSYGGNRVYGELTQNSYSIHLGVKYKNLMFEGGVEMPISYKESFKRPSNSTATDLAAVERGVAGSKVLLIPSREFRAFMPTFR